VTLARLAAALLLAACAHAPASRPVSNHASPKPEEPELMASSALHLVAGDELPPLSPSASSASGADRLTAVVRVCFDAGGNLQSYLLIKPTGTDQDVVIAKTIHDWRIAPGAAARCANRTFMWWLE
jgi:hypothetical protein